MSPSQFIQRAVAAVGALLLAGSLSPAAPAAVGASDEALFNVAVRFTGYPLVDSKLCSAACHTRVDATTVAAGEASFSVNYEPVPAGAYRIAVGVDTRADGEETGKYSDGYLRRTETGRYTVVHQFEEGSEFQIDGPVDLGEIEVETPNYPPGKLRIGLGSTFVGSVLTPRLRTSGFEAGATVTVRASPCAGAEPKVLAEFEATEGRKVTVAVDRSSFSRDYYLRIEISAPGRTTRMTGLLATIGPTGICDGPRLLTDGSIKWSQWKSGYPARIGRYAKLSRTVAGDAIVEYRWYVAGNLVQQGTQAADRRLWIKRSYKGKKVRAKVVIRFPHGTVLRNGYSFGRAYR